MTGSLFKAWSRSECSHACFAYCQEFLPVFNLTFLVHSTIPFPALPTLLLCYCVSCGYNEDTKFSGSKEELEKTATFILQTDSQCSSDREEEAITQVLVMSQGTEYVILLSSQMIDESFRVGTCGI